MVMDMKNKKVGSVLKTESKVIAYVVICLVIIVLGISYALFFEVKGNEKNQIVKAGTLEFTYANGSQITNETNSDCFIPMSNEEALKHSECEYKISITNAGTLPGNYNINLTSETVDKPLELSKLKVILKKEGQVVADYPKDGTTTSLVTNEKIDAGSVINYSVQIYVDADNELLNADDDEKNISLKINGDAVVNSEEVNPPMTAIDYIKNLKTVESGDGLYAVSHDNLTELGQEWNKIEYRYAGLNPNNYVSFNNEIWRIIGLVNVKVGNSVEQRVKIIRIDGIEGQKDFGNYAWDKSLDYNNNWTTSKLKDMLNGIYYESGTGECYTGNNGSPATENTCDFNTGTDLPKGLNEPAREMIDKEVIWNIGGWSSSSITAKQFYEKERGTITGNSNMYPNEWSSKTDVGEKYKGIGLIYPSDYGYATNGGSIGRETCFAKELYNWDSEEENYKSECSGTDWLKPNSGYLWTLSPFSSNSDYAFYVRSSGYGRSNFVYLACWVWPVVYLTSSTKIIDGNGTIEEPYELSVQ